jgi:hypothetical protein
MPLIPRNIENQWLQPRNCFQYRLIFRRGAVQSASPVLLRLGMELVVPGNPDLNWPANAVTITQNADGTTRGVEVRLRNQNLTDSGPTQPANVCHASQPGCNPEGTFFVDVFIFPPGATPISPTLPLLASWRRQPEQPGACAIPPRMSANPEDALCRRMSRI